MQDARGRPEQRLEGEAEGGCRRLIELAVAPPHLHVLGVGDIVTLRPEVPGDVRPAHDETCMQPVIHHVDEWARRGVSQRTSASHRAGASRPQGHERE